MNAAPARSRLYKTPTTSGPSSEPAAPPPRRPAQLLRHRVEQLWRAAPSSASRHAARCRRPRADAPAEDAGAVEFCVEVVRDGTRLSSVRRRRRASCVERALELRPTVKTTGRVCRTSRSRAPRSPRPRCRRRREARATRTSGAATPSSPRSWRSASAPAPPATRRTGGRGVRRVTARAGDDEKKCRSTVAKADGEDDGRRAGVRRDASRDNPLAL